MFVAPVTGRTLGQTAQIDTFTPMKVTLPDGTPLELEDGATGYDAASAIGEGLARAALAVRQNGRLLDLSAPLEDGEPVEIVTSKSADALELYPGTKVSIGPPIENGFYYDFEFPPDVKVGEPELERIEQKMREHI